MELGTVALVGSPSAGKSTVFKIYLESKTKIAQIKSQISEHNLKPEKTSESENIEFLNNKKNQLKSKIEESIDILLSNDIVLHDKIIPDDAKNVLNDFCEKKELEIESEIKLINLKATIIYDIGSTAVIYIAKQELLLYENYYNDLNDFLIQVNNRK